MIRLKLSNQQKIPGITFCYMGLCRFFRGINQGIIELFILEIYFLDWTDRIHLDTAYYRCLCFIGGFPHQLDSRHDIQVEWSEKEEVTKGC